jgi:hypothetical protein
LKRWREEEGGGNVKEGERWWREVEERAREG